MGFELNRFQGDVDEELVCPICSGVLEDPLQVLNESIFIFNNFLFRFKKKCFNNNYGLFSRRRFVNMLFVEHVFMNGYHDNLLVL